ncbi:hypothetical protein Cmtc_22190 [Cupriavidus sp. TKC]|uniref:LPS biosynthesis protein RfbU n=1 Tax=unclassified Cupriavidus TaxID=2640874 RepID=UPI0002A45FFA|nr:MULTISPECIES: LPS biosynthesis protein RfbU [unclassified Cupriavidus]EKZ98483.1 LPS biosynthesis protein, RfbU family [Cupriavidus sp. HMR-1]GMG90999.1 hypothetical protein Cmtc_22190 [Cupriavidus sp. TKC]
MRSFFHWIKGCLEVRSEPLPQPSASVVAELVDTEYYRRRYGAELGSEAPREHFVRVGARSGFDPNPVFDSAFYSAQLETSPAQPGQALLEHYLELGEKSGLRPSPIFDPKAYLAMNPDVAAAGVNALEHFVRWGYKEGRQFINVDAPDLDEAIAQILANDQGNPVALALRTIRNVAQGDLEAARLAADMLPASYCEQILPPLLNSLAERFWVQGELNKAVAAWQQSRRIAPASFSSNGYLGLVLRALGYLDEALAALQDAVDQGDQRPAISDALQALQAEFAAMEATGGVSGEPAPIDAIQLFDTSFPSRLSSFRFGEFSAYLRELPGSRMYSSIWDIKHLHGSDTFTSMAHRFAADQGMAPGRVQLHAKQSVAARVGYCVFLNNANLFFSENRHLNVDAFAFTLYPGGGFELADPNSDYKLRRLCDDSRLGKIITTQNLTYRYLLDNQFCEPNRLLHLFGGVVPMCFDRVGTEAILTTRNPQREILRVCFVAQRYSATGVEKGYDVFVALAEQLRDRDDIEFHVVGGFDADTIPLKVGTNIRFHGIQPSDFFPGFYREMDIIVSPNVSGFRLNGGRGSFDGFPTTCCVEASLCGVAMFLSDFEGLNSDLRGKPIFEMGRDFEKIDRDAEVIADRVLHYAANRESLCILAGRGRDVILQSMSYEAQILPRITTLQDLGARARPPAQ